MNVKEDKELGLANLDLEEVYTNAKAGEKIEHIQVL